MSSSFRVIPFLLVYRHAVFSVGGTVLYFGLSILLPSDDIVWYRTVLLVLTGLYVVLHAFVIWRLATVFSGSADPILYGAAAVCGVLSLLFASHILILALIASIVMCILLLTTVSPRVALFSFPFVHKGWRRLYNMAWTAVVFFALSVLYGVSLFFSSVQTIVPVIVASVVLTCATYSIIRLYVSNTWQQERLTYGVLFLIYIQLSAVSFLLPFGLFSLSLLLTWVWYLVTLLCRFAVSPKGVIWADQWRYLAVHSILFFAVLFWFLRWT